MVWSPYPARVCDCATTQLVAPLTAFCVLNSVAFQNALRVSFFSELLSLVPRTAVCWNANGQ